MTYTSYLNRFRQIFQILTLALFAAGLSLAMPDRVQAAGPICTVDDNAPADYATIQDALADTGCTTIQVAAGSYHGTLSTLGNRLSISIDRDVTIAGAGVGTTFVTNTAANINESASAFSVGAVTVTISDMTISGDSPTVGGALRNSGTLTLARVDVRESIAVAGGGIYNAAGGNLTAIDSTIALNTATGTASATGGAGIYNQGGTVTLQNSTVTGNGANAKAGGIWNGAGGTLTLEESTVRDNTATTDGGGIYNDGQLTLRRSTLTANNTQPPFLPEFPGLGIGGAIFNNDSGVIDMTNSTVVNNQAHTGSGLHNRGQATLTHSTFGRNQVRALGNAVNITAVAGQVNVRGTILTTDNLDPNSASPNGNCARSGGAITSLGYNLTDDNCLGGATDLNAVIRLGPLQDNGGPTLTRAPLANSPAIDAIPAGECTVTSDQRGLPRPFGAGCEIGAVEIEAPTAPTITIDTPADNTRVSAGSAIVLSGSANHPVDGDLSDSIQWHSDLAGALGSGATINVNLAVGVHTITAQVTSGEGTTAEASITLLVCVADVSNESELATAIACANAAAGGTETIALVNDITLSTATTALNNPSGTTILIDGNGHSVDGGGHDSVFVIAANTTVEMRQLTIQNGGGNGGAGIRNGGVLTLVESTVHNNTVSPVSGTAGGGIANSGILTLVRSTVSGNRAPAAGGIISFDGSSLTVENSTISGNQATAGGAGALWIMAGAQATLRFATISDNSGVIFGGLYNNGTLDFAGTIIANHTNGDCTNDGGSVTDVGFNLVEDGSCISASSSSGGDPQLGPLADNGGPTLTHALLTGSPASDVIPALPTCPLPIDQRGVARPQDLACDIGAVEWQAPDEDSDGVADEIENVAPNGGDGNHDGIADSLQNNVASLISLVNGGYVTVEAPTGTTLSAVSPQNQLFIIQPSYLLIIGTVGFTLEDLTPGAAVDVVLYLENAPAYNSYYKYGATIDEPTEHWYGFNYDGVTGAERQSDRIILHLLDGGRGDSDLAANGVIVDPGALGLVSNTAPTITADNATVTVNAGTTATNSGTFADAEFDTVTLSTSVGTVVDNGDGTWSWSFATGGPVDSQTVTITADDGNGGVSIVTFDLAVVYAFSGFFAPAENAPTVNVVNAGQSVPIKFSLGGDYGLAIFAEGYPASQTMACGNSGSGDPIEETSTPGSSTLQYDPDTGIYTYVWKTEKAWGSSCRQLMIQFADGTEQSALFQFKGKGAQGAAVEEESAATQIFLPLVTR